MSEIVIKEKLLNGYPGIISYECTKKIIEQMEKNIFKIKLEMNKLLDSFVKYHIIIK